MLIRAECSSDGPAVHAINRAAFEGPGEADLVDALREQADPIVSLVAEQDGEILGHILFTPVSLSENPDLRVMGLGPMAVAPMQQRKGIGSSLVREGLARCGELEFVAVVVLGHPEYYPRFGFLPASRFGIDSRYAVPDDVFMAVELVPEALTGRTGRATYHAAFDEL